MHVSAVVVAYNRRTLLEEALRALDAQERRLDSIIVVDNASTDGSGDVVSEILPGATLITLPRNTGGAGGFAVGVARAVEDGADLVWIMDDDTIPTPTALSHLVAAYERASIRPSVIGSRVVWTDGRDHPMNTPRPNPFASTSESAAAATIGCVPVRSSSFVSCLVDAEAVRELGLPIADYFIWNDDFEFTARLIRGRSGLYCPGSVVLHKTKRLADTDDDPGERFFYEVRNKIWLFRHSRALAPFEKCVYLGATVRRWIRTFQRSNERATLRSAFALGWRDGWRTPPRPTAECLADLGPVSQVVARIESAVGTHR